MNQFVKKDTLVLLISIVRIFDNMDAYSFEFNKIAKHILSICQQNNALWSLKSVLFQGITIINPNYNKEALNRIEYSLPEKKNTVNKEILTLLTIPTDLRIHAFQYLYESDLYQLKKTCQCFNVDASVTIEMGKVGLCEDETCNNIHQLTTICRKLNQCNTLELAKSIETIIDILDDEFLLRLVLVRGICCYHRKMGANLLNKVLSKLPNETLLSINDSITKSGLIVDDDDSDDDEMKQDEPIGILQIPVELRLYILQY
eukprot:392640_1